MKKFLLKTHLGVLVLVGVFIFGFGQTKASAQLINPTGILPDAPVWVSQVEAINRLNQEIDSMNTQLQGSNDLGLVYKIKFYSSIKSYLEEGQPVSSALDKSYIRFIAVKQDMPVEIPNPLGKPTLDSFYQDAALLLQD